MERGGVYVLRWHDDGRLKQETTKFKVGVKAERARAEELLAERTKVNALKARRDQLAVLIAEREDLETRIKALEAKATPTAERLKLGGLVEAWKRSPRRKDCGDDQRERYGAQLGAFVEWAGKEIEVAAVDDGMAERYAAALGAWASGSTYNKHLNALTAAWKAVGRAAGCPGNPWADLPRKRLETHVRRSLTDAEIAKILKVAEGEWKALILIGLHTGLRLGDACRLTWGAFKADGTVEVVTGKTGALVKLPGVKFRGELAKVLGKRGGDDAQRVVAGIWKKYESDAAAISDGVREIFERAKIKTRVKEKGWSKARPDASFHSLRHTFVTRAIEAGVPAPIVRALVGHSTAAMTDRYSHVSGEAVAAAFEKAGL